VKPTKLKILGLILAGILGIILIFFLWPLPKQLQSEANREPMRILDRNGKLLYESRDENFGLQEYLAFQDIPKDIIKIAVAVEDGTFYKHIGISPKGIIRAAWQNFLSGKIVSGGSTITQQLVRNRLKPEHRGYIYKIREILLALKLETRMFSQKRISK